MGIITAVPKVLSILVSVLGTPGLDIVLFIGKEGGSTGPPFFVPKC